ncbi:MAG TPA: phospho-N-acetylmuramoyl-pentapeptide-transferase [Acidimicrobiales bacterium]|jgi:phospho-N-acetylmuramoyl-pentapeptide-transferase|nr:phospho-N-acetylmuramoyl-pentapeptide-transferase [Acidimicrobiales bacterium]
MIPLLIAGAISLAVSLVGTRHLIDWLRDHKMGQPIHEDVPDGHTVKAGTPTMGGVAIVVAAAVGYAASHFHGGLLFTRSGLLVMLAIAAAGMVGALDDWIKISHERNLGLNKRAKMGGLLLVAVGFSVATVLWTDVETTLSFTRWNEPGWKLGQVIWVVWAVLLILGTTNAVNLTDGLDGLAAGTSIYAYLAVTVIAFWDFRHFDVYHVNHALDLSVIAAAMVGAITGFLWWNAPPAQIFMGDTGSLAIGAGLATLGLTLNIQLLLPIIGALFVFETLSVIVQVGSFQIFHRRVFRMAPVHHHFELGGWPETTVIIRFWVLALMATAVALGIYYADFVSTGALD